MPHNQRVEPTPQRLLGQEGSCFGMILICESVISDSSLILPLVSVTWSCVSDSIEGSPGHLTRKSRRHHVCHSHRPGERHHCHLSLPWSSSLPRGCSHVVSASEMPVKASEDTE
jgi:hypothetical protein